MNRGAWHQCGDKSQKLVLEQLEAGHGVGVILSPRDLTRSNAVEYAAQYAALDAPVLIDPQFYVPDFSNDNLDTYGLSTFRTTLGTLGQITDAELDALSTELETLASELGVWAVVAPAAMYEAGRPDIAELNARLFKAAKSAGDALGVPTLATVTLARSVTSLRRPQFSWTRVKGEFDVQGGWRDGSVEQGKAVWVSADGGSPEGDRSPC